MRVGAVLLCCSVVLAAAPERMVEALSLQRTAIASGQLWRLWTAHLVHFSVAHALCDGLPLALVAVLVERDIFWKRTTFLVLSSLPVLSLSVLGMTPELAEYRGGSGLLMLLGGLAACLWMARQRDLRAPLALCVGVAALKIVLEALGSPVLPSTLPEGVHVAWQIHGTGLAAGLLLGTLLLRRRRIASIGDSARQGLVRS